MKNKTLFFCSVFFCLPVHIPAQQSGQFSMDAYIQFLEANEGLTPEGLSSMYPSDEYALEAARSYPSALFSDSVFRYYQFNEEEIGLIEQNGFMVSDRIRYKSFGEAFMSIYKRDLPVYISSDAVLHAIHMSYSNILSTLEKNVLYEKVDTLLSLLHAKVPELQSRYEGNELMQVSLQDMDLYLTIPRQLLGNQATPYFPENEEGVQELIERIKGASANEYPLFTDVPRTYDFSQFTPRGHYTQSEKLTRYFKAMMWLGRTEFYLKVPGSVSYNILSKQKRDSIGQRQTLTSYLIIEALENPAASRALEDIDEIIRYLVGESDNVVVDQLASLKQEIGFSNASYLADMDSYLQFRETLLEQTYSGQKILSQILVQDASSPEEIVPASAFMLLGQRFIIDSYILGSVVFDKIPAYRMLPKSADVLFALGNNDAFDILENDLETFGYSKNLAGLRYLVDSYQPEFWEDSFFNMWLNSIRQLNPPEDRSKYPDFTQTEAWSNKTMTTQLASWAQLRHDNLLYAKQSYTGGPVCEFPFSYVEPNPDFFEAIQTLALGARESFHSLSSIDENMLNSLDYYFSNVAEINGKLKAIAQNQLDGVPNSGEQNTFLREMLHEEMSGCVIAITGWYSNLYYKGETDLLKEDFIVADVHTSPFDEAGNMVGWVMHAGTGPLNLATIITELPDGNEYTFVGPVMSYYEFVSDNFKRYTDEEWVETFETEPVAARPEFTGSYLATSGEYYYDYREYVPVSNEGPQDPQIPQTIELTQNYPNPFNAGTVIRFRIPSSQTNSQVSLEIFNIQGQLVETLINRRMTSGNYSAHWEANAASGTYFYRLKVGDEIRMNKMVLIK